MLKLKLQYFGHLMQRVDSLEKMGCWEKIEGRKRWGQQRMRCHPTRMASMIQKDMSLSKFQEIVKDRGAWRATVHGVTESQMLLSN